MLFVQARQSGIISWATFLATSFTLRRENAWIRSGLLVQFPQAVHLDCWVCL